MVIVLLDVRFTLDPDPHILEVPPSTLVTLSRPPLSRRSRLASARSEAYTLEPSIQAVTWLTCSRGPKLQSVRGAGIERTNSMHRCLKYRVDKKKLYLAEVAVFWIRIRIDFDLPDLDSHWECRFGSRRTKMTRSFV